MSVYTPSTIPELLARLGSRGDRRIITYDPKSHAAQGHSYAQLVHRALATGRAYRDRGFKRGDLVFLQLTDSLQLIESFLGAIAAGLVPCCLAPPRALGGLDVFRGGIKVLFEHFPGAHLVTQPHVGEALGVAYSNPPDTLDEHAVLSPDPVDPESIAFVQLTSGTTTRPKAVRISHRALLAHCKHVITAMRGDPNADSFVSWLPFHHDMGLVGSLFVPLVLPCDLHLIRPEHFLACPLNWLRIISNVQKSVISNAPNNAFRASVQRTTAEEAARLDLSRWRVAGCGAERVRAETLEAFAAHFKSAGFRMESFVPCYGLAEATLAVTYGYGGRIPPIDNGNVSCGRPIPETEIVIRNEAGNPLPDGAQGEITVRSMSLCSGYAGFREPSTIRDGWLYTGDRGYVREGELYVTGRYKELIILDGVNIDCDEIEAIGEQLVAAPARSAAFAIEIGDGERVVLINETTPQPEAVFESWCDEMLDRVARTFGFRLLDVVFVRRGKIPKTSSGKIRRAELRRLYNENLLESIWRRTPPKCERSSVVALNEEKV